MHSVLRLHTVDVYVRDLELSIAFYRDKLGFAIAFDARLSAEERIVGMAPPDGDTVLRLVQPQPHSVEHKLIGRATRIAFVTEDVASTFRVWSARGVRFRHAPRLRRVRYAHEGAASPIWGQVFTRFEDRDRNSFALVSFDIVNQEIAAQRRALGEKEEAERRAAQEIEIARQVQSRLFPQRLPQLRTVEYAGMCVQARQVGGDYYDFIQLDKERLAFVLGDIAGKGIAAALLMANLQANLRSQFLIAREEPGRFLGSVNKLFFENTTSSAYATLFFAEYDDRRQCLRYVNCGHLPALLLRADGAVERLDSTCTVLGLFPAWECEVAEREVRTGDTLAIYSDGVTEAFDHHQNEFGEERLVEALARHRRLRPDAVIQAVFDEVRAFSSCEQHDDMTLILIKCSGNETGR